MAIGVDAGTGPCPSAVSPSPRSHVRAAGRACKNRLSEPWVWQTPGPCKPNEQPPVRSDRKRCSYSMPDHHQRPCNTPPLRPGKWRCHVRRSKGIQQGDERSPRLMPRLSRVQPKIFKVERSASNDPGDSPYATVALKLRARSCLRHGIVPRSISELVDEATQTTNILILVSFDPNDAVVGQPTRQPS